MFALALLACAVGGGDAPAAPGSAAAASLEPLARMTAAARRVTELSEAMEAHAADPARREGLRAELAEARLRLAEARAAYAEAEGRLAAP